MKNVEVNDISHVSLLVNYLIHAIFVTTKNYGLIQISEISKFKYTVVKVDIKIITIS